MSPGYRLCLQELEWVMLDELAAAGMDVGGLRVLEVGCGSGYFLSRFLEYGAAHAAGIDLMEERIAKARARDPRLELVAGDASELPWPADSFDIVSQFTCLSSVLDGALRHSIADEMWRVTRPGGVVLSYDIRPAPAPVTAVRWLIGMAVRHPAQSGGTPTQPVPAHEIRDLFPTAAIRSRTVTLMTDLAAVAGHSAVLARGLQAIPFLRTHLLTLARKPG